MVGAGQESPSQDPPRPSELGWQGRGLGQQADWGSPTLGALVGRGDLEAGGQREGALGRKRSVHKLLSMDLSYF